MTRIGKGEMIGISRSMREWQKLSFCLHLFAISFRRFGQQNCVLSPHLFVGFVPSHRLLLGEPGDFDVGFGLLEIRNSTGNDGVHEHQMPTEPRLDWALPRSGGELRNCLRERGTEFL